MKPGAKYSVVGVAGGSLIGQATELLQWIASIALPYEWQPIPEQAAILLASILIVTPLALIMPPSDRSKDETKP